MDLALDSAGFDSKCRSKGIWPTNKVSSRHPGSTCELEGGCLYKDNQRPQGRVELYLMRVCPSAQEMLIPPLGWASCPPTSWVHLKKITSLLGFSHACVISCLSRVRLFATLWTVARQAPLSMGILQARIVEWVAISSSRGSFWPWDRAYVSCVSCIGRWVLCHWCHLGFCFLVCNMEGLKFSEVPFVTDVPSFSELLLRSTLWGSQPLTLGSFWVLLSLPLVLVISWQEAGRLGNGYGAAHSTQKRLLPLGQWVGSLASWSSIVNLMQQKMKEVNSLLRIPRDCEGN